MGFCVNVLLTPLLLYYLLQDWPRLMARFDAAIPRPWHGAAKRILGQVDAVLSEFLRGQIMVMLILALYYGVALWLAGVGAAVPVGVLTGLLIFIPYVGYGVGLTLALLVAVLQFQGLEPVIAVAAVYGLGQLVESFLLTPYLVGERIGLHPMAVIFALLAFSQLFGFAGVLIALPASAALLVGLREVRALYLRSRFYRGPEG
jgi:predicted PurR-regulated permease PerM